MPAETITERTGHWNDQLTIDRDGRIVRNVALAGPVSRNGYFYADRALEDAAALYADKPVFLDHAANRQRSSDRSTRDLVGTITSPRFQEGRIRGDIRVLDTESGEMFLKLVEAASPGVGMSHVVLAERSADGKTVERIADVISVDVVVNPATTSTFQESASRVQEEKSGDPQLPLPPDGETTPSRTSGSPETVHLEREIARLRGLLTESQRRGEVDDLLSASGLPAAAITECFRNQLLACSDSSSRQRLVQDRLQLLSLSRGPSRTIRSDERGGEFSSATVDEQFVRAVRRK